MKLTVPLICAVMVFSVWTVPAAAEHDGDDDRNGNWVTGRFHRLVERQVDRREYLGVVLTPLEGRGWATLLIPGKKGDQADIARDLEPGQVVSALYVTEDDAHWVLKLKGHDRDEQQDEADHPRDQAEREHDKKNRQREKADRARERDEKHSPHAEDDGQEDDDAWHARQKDRDREHEHESERAKERDRARDDHHDKARGHDAGPEKAEGDAGRLAARMRELEERIGHLERRIAELEEANHRLRRAFGAE